MTAVAAVAPPEERQEVSRWRMTVATLGVTAVVFFSSTPVTVALPDIGADLGHIRLLPWVISAYVLGSAVGLLACGSVIDSFGVRRTFQLCVGWYLATTLLCAVSPAAPALVGARGLQGIGSGFAQGAGFAAIAVAYPASMRQRMFAANSTLWGIAGLVAPTLGSLVVTNVGWRGLFAVNLVVAATAASLGWRILPGRLPHAPALRLDGAGIAILGTGTGFMLVAFGSLSLGAVPFVAATALLAAAYWRHAGRAPAPVVPRHLLLGAPHRWLDVTGLLAFAIPWGLSAYAALVVIAGRGDGEATAALVVTSSSVGWIGGSLVAGLLWRGRDLTSLLQVGCALMVVGAAGGALAWSSGGPIIALVAAGLATGLGGGITNNVSLGLTQAWAPPGELARTLSAFQFVRNFGSAAGAALTGAVIFTVVGMQVGSVDRLRDALEPGDLLPASPLAAGVRTGSVLAHAVAAVLGLAAVAAAWRLHRWSATAPLPDDADHHVSTSRARPGEEEVPMSEVVAVVGNPKAGSRTRTVAEAVARRLAEHGEPEVPAKVATIDLADHADQLFDWSSAKVGDAVETVRGCRVLVVASPTYKASFTGLLKAFLDRFPNEGLAGVVAVPVMVGAGPQHALAVDQQLRPVLVALGASCPTGGLYLTESQLPDLPETVDAWCAAELPKLPAH